MRTFDLAVWASIALAALMLLRSSAKDGTGTVPRSRSGSGPVPPSLRWTVDASDAGRKRVELAGLPSATIKEIVAANWSDARWQRLLLVLARPADLASDSGIPPLAGGYRVDGGLVLFEPMFPVAPGVDYSARFDSSALPTPPSVPQEPVVARLHVPLPRIHPTTEVTRIYPTASVLPQNLLKFYVHFSAPMTRGPIYQHIRLSDDSGRRVELPFLEIDEQLWDPTMTRLTLLLDPGRIKRGVRPLEEIGPALEVGKSYTLVIAKEWHDAAGQPLKETHEKHFRVVAPDRESPDTAKWKITAPRSGGRSALGIVVPEPLDHAVAQRMIHVVDPQGNVLEGAVRADQHETRWSFTPAKAWVPGLHHVVVPKTIEDLAGNNIGKLFDVDLQAASSTPAGAPFVNLVFETR